VTSQKNTYEVCGDMVSIWCFFKKHPPFHHSFLPTTTFPFLHRLVSCRWYWNLNSGRASHLLGRCSTPWALPPPFRLWLFGGRSCFLSSWPGPWSSHFKLPIIAGMTGAHHHAQLFFSVEMGSHKLFCVGLVWKHDPCDLSLPSS
jgi:hypothetical protein